MDAAVASNAALRLFSAVLSLRGFLGLGDGAVGESCAMGSGPFTVGWDDGACRRTVAHSPGWACGSLRAGGPGRVPRREVDYSGRLECGQGGTACGSSRERQPTAALMKAWASALLILWSSAGPFFDAQDLVPFFVRPNIRNYRPELGGSKNHMRSGFIVV